MKRYMVILSILMIGAFLRWSALPLMSGMLTHDEAYYGLDTLSLMESPRFTPFFPANYGRQSLWCYILIPFIAIWGANPFALRLAATLTSILTLAAAYRLGRSMMNDRAARWATLALTVSQWHVHQSRLAIRAILMLPVGMMAFIYLLKAHKSNKPSNWIGLGFWTGLLLYTYFSALFWILFIILSIPAVGRGVVRRWRGPLIVLAVTGLISLPMLFYTIAHPRDVLQRPEMLMISSIQDFWGNIRLWVGAWFQTKPGTNAQWHNPLSPSAVDPILTPVFLLGIVAIWWAVRQRRHVLWIGGLLMASLLPSLLTQHAPHFLRAIGLVIPLSYITGAGAWAIEKGGRCAGWGKLSVLIPLLLFVTGGLVSYRNNENRLHLPEVFTMTEQHVNESANWIKSAVPPNTPVYFSPFALSHPIIAFRRADLAPRPVGAFDSHICMVVPDRPAVYVSVTLYEPDFQQKLSRWANTSVLFQDPDQTPPRYAVFQAVPKPEILQGPGTAGAVFGERVEMRLPDPISSTAKAGATVPVPLALRALQPLDRDYSIFVHLYGDPTPYEGGPLWAQIDGPPCGDSNPSNLWRTDEWVLSTFFSLALPADLPPGHYTIGVGVYDSVSGIRLSVPGQPHDFLPLQQLEVR